MKQIILNGILGILCVLVSCSHEPPKSLGSLRTETETTYPTRIIDAHSHFSLEEEAPEPQPSVEMEQMYENARSEEHTSELQSH